MSARFWTPRLEVIEEECEIENIIFSEGALNEKGNSRFENERDDKRDKTKGDRTKLGGKKRDKNTLGGKSANATGKQENKKEEKSGDEKRENQRDEGK